MFVQRQDSGVTLATATKTISDMTSAFHIFFDAIHLSVCVYMCERARTNAHMKTTFIVGVEKWQKTPALNGKYSRLSISILLLLVVPLVGARMKTDT